MDDQRATAFDAYLGSNAGTGPDYAVSDAEGRPIAAKWRRPASRSRLTKLGQNVLMYHIGGSTSVSMFIKGKCQGTGSQHGSLTFRPHDLELESVRSGVFEMMHLYLDQDMINLYAQQNLVATASVDIDPFFAIRDPWLQGYFAMLVSEFEFYGGIDRQARPWHPERLGTTRCHHALSRPMIRHGMPRRSLPAPDHRRPSRPGDASRR